MGCISSKSTKDEDDSDNDKTKKPFKNGSSMRLDDVSLTHKSDANNGAASAAAQEAHKKGKGLLEELRDNKIPVDSRAERVALIAEKMFADVLLEGFSEALPWAKPIVVVIKGILGAIRLAKDVQGEITEFGIRITKLSIILNNDKTRSQNEKEPNFVEELEAVLTESFEFIMKCCKPNASGRDKLWQIVLSHSNDEQLKNLKARIEEILHDTSYAKQENICRSLANLYEAQESAKRKALVSTLKSYHIDFLRFIYNEHNVDTDTYQEQTEVLRSIDAWFNNEEGEVTEDDGRNRVFVISAEQGSGKTTLAAAVCRRFMLRMLSAFFFEYNDSRRNNLRHMILAVAFQLYRKINDTYIKLIPETCLDDVGNADFNYLHDNLISNHLSALNRFSDKMLLVIDGADECCLENQKLLINFIKGFHSKTPKWLYLLVTTRPVHNIVDGLSGTERLILERNGIPGNDRTMAAYLAEQLVKIYQTNDEIHKAAELICQDGPNFRYADCVISELQRRRNAGQVLAVSDMEELIKHVHSLSEFYRRDFQMLKNEINDISKYKSLLAVVIACQEPLHVNILNYYIGLLDLKKDANEILSVISRHVNITNSRVHFCHKSVRDWLLDSTHHGSANIVHDGHLELGQLCTKALQLFYSGKPDRCPELLEYAIQHAIHHYTEVDGFENEVTKMMCNLKYIERKLRTPSPNMAAVLLQDYCHEHISESNNNKVTLQNYLKLRRKKEKINDYQKFVSINARALQECPQLVYQCAANHTAEVEDLKEQAEEWTSNNSWIEIMLDPRAARTINLSASFSNNVWAIDLLPQSNLLICCTSDVNNLDMAGPGAELHLVDIETFTTLSSVPLDNHLNVPIVKWDYFKNYAHCKAFRRDGEVGVLFGSREFVAVVDKNSNEVKIVKSHLMIGDTWEYFPTCCNVIANLVAFGLYKKVLASNDTEQQSDSAASPQSAIIVQDISSGVILRRFQQLTNSIISCCKFSENGEFVLSYSLGEDKIRMWNIDTEELYSTEISVPNSTHLDFHVVDNDCLIIHSISGDQQTIVNVWRDGTVIEIIRYVGEVPIGVYYVPAVERAVIVEPGDNRWAAKSMKVSLINPWSSEPQNIERVLDSTEESFMSYLGGVIGLLVTSKEDQLDRLVYRAGKRVGSYRMNDVMTATHVSRDDVDTAGDKFYDSVFTSNGSMLVLQTIYKDAGKIKLDLLDSKTIVKSSPMANTVEMPESDYAVFRLKPIISNDDTMVLVDSGRSKLEVGRSKIYVWNMETGKIRKLANPSISDGDYHIKCFSFSPDSRMIFVSFKQALVNEDAVDVFNADYASYVKQYTNRGAFILYMEPKQQEAATYTSKGKLCFWNWESGEMKHTNEAHSVISHGITNRDSLAMPAAWHQASEKIAVVQVDYKYVRLLLYDMRKREAKELSGAEVEDPDGEYDYPYSYVLAFSPDSDGSVLATSVASGGITLWNTRRFTKQVVLDCEVPIFVTGAWLSTTQLIVLQGGDNDFAVRILTFCSSAARPSLNNVVVENYVAVPSESMATVAPSRDALAIVKENVGLLLLSFNGFVKSDAAVATAAYVLGVK